MGGGNSRHNKNVDAQTERTRLQLENLKNIAQLNAHSNQNIAKINAERDAKLSEAQLKSEELAKKEKQHTEEMFVETINGIHQASRDQVNVLKDIISAQRQDRKEQDSMQNVMGMIAIKKQQEMQMIQQQTQEDQFYEQQEEQKTTCTYLLLIGVATAIYFYLNNYHDFYW